MKNDFRILSTRLMDRLLEVDSTQRRVKSGASPAAQSVTLLQRPSDPLKDYSTIESKLDHIKKQDLKLWYLIQFMIASACRISEVLSIIPSRITRTGHVKLIASKGSTNRIVFAGLAAEYMIKSKANNASPFEGWSRFYVYRQFKKYGIQSQYHGRKNKSVTHSIRHTVALANAKEAFEISDTQLQLGHKSTKSTKYYHESESSRK